MNSEFPDIDDEFDLLHEDEYEVLRELEADETQRTCTNNDFAQKQQEKPNGISQRNVNAEETAVESSIENHNKELQALFTIENKQSQLSLPVETTRKRPIDQISQNLAIESCDNMNFEEFAQEKKRPCWDQPEELMKLILDKRKIIYNNGLKDDRKASVSVKTQTNSISRKVPLTDFVAVTRSEDGERFYIKVSERSSYKPQNYRTTSNLLSKPIQQLKDEAEEISLRNLEKKNLAPLEHVNNENVSTDLWVDKYRPKRYIDLLSDENVNRSLLYWLKLWDKIVFDRDPTVRSRKPQMQSKFKNKFKKKVEDVPDHDSNGFPTQKIALLTGPPGLGKTTLAHVAARHAGYNIVEINASDDRGPEAFRVALLSSTQMKALIDKEKRPNCLILDEIDGAPTASIELLLKFIYGKLSPKGRQPQATSQKENNGCRRPVICICNDLYTPSLRSLRNIALVINVPEVTSSTLAARLYEIAYKEGLNIDLRILMQLAEKSGCDIRACLGILQYSGGAPNILQNIAFGLKDTRKGLFDAWKEIFQIPIDRKGALSGSERTRKILKILQQSEPDRLVQGIFHNYPLNCKNNIVVIYKSLEWFQFYDEVNTFIANRQSWMLTPYTSSAFVAWHLHLAGFHSSKITFPTIPFEVNQKIERNEAILSIMKKTSKIDKLTLVSEVLPYLPDLLSPRLRSVNAQLYSEKEKHELGRLVNLMIDFGLTYTQEKKAEGGYDYYLDPNIWNIGAFPDCKARKPLPYAVKQIVIQELENTRLQNIMVKCDEIVENTCKSTSTTFQSKNNSILKAKAVDAKGDKNIPNHLKQLNPVELKAADQSKCRNFFLSFQLAGQQKLKEKQAKEKEQGIANDEIASNSNSEDKLNIKKRNDLFKSDVWFQYNEGYSNAVRRTVLMEDLL
ncbi:PREDICTED: chromosome transmission fidelity protein 18 homolog [Ceratosolen solmsi marchali]|uniref:Chromosome transmission fidelity protein 18 homolog n=1 Tax=Ceratosolen solmsi marchali TaxID=326594 RepID=A0AAJ6YFN3_9HYME|nr:PREDICTED: chromosome transmission fidelity protein 18 homolog [Ceratosolen solmsi marchali]